MAADIDVRAVATFTSTPETTISTLLQSPTVELVRSLLHTIGFKAQEHGQLQSQKLRLEVELEAAVRTNESKVKTLKSSVERGLVETSKLRAELQNSENSRTKAEAEKDRILTTQSQEHAEASSLKSQLSSLEAANRDTTIVLESKATSYDKLSEEFNAQQQKAHSLRRRVVELEQNIQSASSTAASTRFREQGLQQDIDILTRNNEWFETELATKNADHLKFRKDKSARITELQQLNEQSISEVDSLRRSEMALRNRLDEQIHKFEDSLTTIQQLREETLQTADAFRVELDSASRLAELQKKSADTAKQRAHELSIALGEAKEDAADEVGRIRAEIETEHNDRIAAEQAISELQKTISGLEQTCQQLQTESDLFKGQPSSSRSVNGREPTTPSRPSSASGIFAPSPASRVKGNLSMTQLFAEYKKAEKELAAEKRRSEQLSRSLEEMVEGLENTSPGIDEMRGDRDRLSGEVLELSTLRDAATTERDRAVRDFRKLQGQIQETRQERDSYQQQVRDASSQIKILLMEQHSHQTGQQISQEEMRDLRQAALGDEGDFAAMTDTGRFISENLTIFKNIVELQNQNTQIRTMLRQLGEQMEVNEANEKSVSRQNEREELEVLRIRVSTYKDELQSMVTQSRSYIKERDMFRNMLVRRGQVPVEVESSAFAQSMPLPASGSAQGPGMNSSSSAAGEQSDYGGLLKDLQHHFDSYKQEAATDNTALRAQLDGVSKRNTQLQIDLSKHVSQLTAANQRGEMLQANYNMLKSESLELHKRSDTIRENATKQEIRTQQAAEELVGVKGETDNLRREIANLKAEKDLWKSIEKRLVQDNEDVRNERGRLDNLNATLQNILNEREQSDAESHRRSGSRIETLESDLQTAKRKLSDEVEESKRTTKCREYEHEQSQSRIDDLMTSLASVREESMEAKTARDHLQSRVEEITIELRSAEERLQMLQVKPAPKEGSGEAVDDENDPTARVQELFIEVSELKRDYELKENELERLGEQIETYQSISQSSEERMQELSETNDQYREETERVLAEKDATIKDLEQRISDISTELATTNNDLSRLRDEQSTSERRIGEQKASFDEEIRRLKDQIDQQTIRGDQLLEDVKMQANIASEHQQSYDTELLKHAEAAKTLQGVRADNNQLRLEMVELRTAAESAKTALEQREESWGEQKVRSERELVDLRKRREEVVQQNTLLHGQLEEITKQITLLKRDRAPPADGGSDATAGPGLDSLQEVIKYLRREKEIVDVQYHLSTQESKRLKQQLDHVQSQLDETRLKLDQQLRADADVERNALSHNKLMETLNELNLYRESSVTLRAEAKKASTALAEKTRRIEDIIADAAPLRTRIAELENLAELREGEMKLLQEDRDHWQTRTQNILAKYDRVDPAELESLKAGLLTLEAEREQTIASRDSLQEQVDTIPQQIEAAKQDLRARLAEQFKAKMRDLNGRINQKQVELDTANSQKAELQTELDSGREQLKSLQENAGAHLVNGSQNEPLESTIQPASSVQESVPQPEDLTGRIAELEAKLQAKAQEIEVIKDDKESAVKARENEMRNVLNKRLAEVKAEMLAASSIVIQGLEDKLQAQQKEMETLRTTKASTNETMPIEGVVNTEKNSESQPTATDQGLPSLSEDQARMLVRENETVRNILRANVRKSVDKAKEDMRKEFEALPKNTEPSTSNGFTQDFEQRVVAEKEKLIKELDSKFESEKQAILNAQQKTCTSEKQALLEEQEAKIASARQTIIIDLQEKFAEERLTFSKDAERKIADQVALAEKRTAAKMNMALNQAKNANAKIQVVVKAAEETAEKPVGEVWAIAKNAKPPSAAQAGAAAKAVASLPAPPQASPGSNQKAQPDGVGPSDTRPGAKAENFIQETPPQSVSQTQSQVPLPAASPGVKPITAAPLNESLNHQQSGIPRPGQANHAGGGPAIARSLQSHLPRGSRGGRGAGQSQQQSHIGGGSDGQQPPQQGGGRGSGIPRGGPRGRGQLRGGAQQVQTSIAHDANQNQAGSSPRGSLNAQAKQFNPQGSKRGREEGAGEEQEGKRMRGGGASN